MKLTRLLIIIFSIVILFPISSFGYEEPWDSVERRTRPIKTKRKIIKHRIKSVNKKRSMPFKVILPRDYEIDKERRYGVVLYLCGLSGAKRGSGSYPVYFSIWCKLPRTLDNLYKGKLTKKSLAWKVTDSELKEFNDKLAEDSFEDFIAVDLWHPSASRDLNWDKFVVEELLPFLDKNYRTIPKREFRAIDGACGGGAIALITAFRNPEAFGNCGGMQTDLGTFPNTFKFFKENRDRIVANPLNVNLNTNKNDVCNDYYFRNSKDAEGNKIKVPRGAHARLEVLLKEAGCNVQVKVFRHCKHGYSAYRYANGHHTSYFHGKIFKKHRMAMQGDKPEIKVDKTEEVKLNK